MDGFTIQFGRLVAYHGEDTQVVIPDTVTSIGRRAFYFSKVTSVVISDSVTEIEQEAFMFAKLERIELGRGIKKIGADAFLCKLDEKKHLFPYLPIALFAKKDQERAFYHFVHEAKNSGYSPDVYEKNLAYVRKHLLCEIEYKRICIDVLSEKYELLKEVLSSGKLSAKDRDELIARLTAANKPQVVALLLECQK